MGNAKKCPECRLVNLSEAQRCECGCKLSTRSMTELDDYRGCQGCGANTETRYVDFNQNIGLVILRLHTSASGEMCWECINQKFWAMTGTTLVLGWWGIISFFFTPFILINNVVRYLGCLGMGSPPVQKSKAGKGSRPRQLVGQNCALCGKRISSAFESQYCPACGAPAHNACTRPGEGTGCSACGAPARDKANED